jgi:hypothetical protein
VVRDREIDGIVVWARDVPVMGVAGTQATGAPAGLLHVEASRLSVQGRDRLLRAAREHLQGLDLGASSALASSPDLKFLRDVPLLIHLDLRDNEGLHDIQPLRSCRDLRSLILMDCLALEDISPLADLGELRTLCLNGCSELQDVSPLKALGCLQDLDLSSCPKLTDLTPIGTLSNLRTLQLRDCRADLAPLAGLSKLETLRLSGSGKREGLDAVIEANPGLRLK